MTENSNEWNQLLKKLNQPVKTNQKTETHLLAVTLPEDSWKKLSATGKSTYLEEADLVAWTLSAYIDRHKASGDLLTIMFDKGEKLQPDTGALVILFANFVSSFSVEILNKISLDTLYFVRLMCATLLQQSEYANDEYVKKLLDVSDSIIAKRFEIISDVATRSLSAGFGITHE